MKQVALYVLTLTGLISACESSEPNSAPQTFREAAPFPVGAAMDPKLLAANLAYRQVAGREFNSLTSENYLKMGLVHPLPDLYDWTGSDVLVNFAEQHEQRVHGHALIWHHSVPDWVTNFKGDSIAWENLFKSHIQRVVNHYGNRIQSWDVVNEAYDDDGSFVPTIWARHLGPDYIARAFQYAHQANPTVKLFYNDFGHEYSPKHLAATVSLANDLKRRGVPIHGLGLEMHTHLSRADSLIENAIRQTASTGLLIHISELEVRVNPTNLPNYVISDADIKAQQLKFASIIRAYRTLVPKVQQFGITTWNIGDADSWVPGACNCPDYPLPFDKSYQKKPVFDTIMKTLEL